MEPTPAPRTYTIPDGSVILTREHQSRAGKAGSAMLTPEERRARARWANVMKAFRKRGGVPPGREWTRRESRREQSRLMVSKNPTDREVATIVRSGFDHIAAAWDSLDKRQRSLILQAVWELDTGLEVYRRHALRVRRMAR